MQHFKVKNSCGFETTTEKKSFFNRRGDNIKLKETCWHVQQ